MSLWPGTWCQLLDDGIRRKGRLGHHSLPLDLEERAKDNLNYTLLSYCTIEMMHVNAYALGSSAKIKLDVHQADKRRLFESPLSDWPTTPIQLIKYDTKLVARVH